MKNYLQICPFQRQAEDTGKRKETKEHGDLYLRKSL